MASERFVLSFGQARSENVPLNYKVARYVLQREKKRYTSPAAESHTSSGTFSWSKPMLVRTRLQHSYSRGSQRRFEAKEMLVALQVHPSNSGCRPRVLKHKDWCTLGSHVLDLGQLAQSCVYLGLQRLDLIMYPLQSCRLQIHVGVQPWFNARDSFLAALPGFLNRLACKELLTAGCSDVPDAPIPAAGTGQAAAVESTMGSHTLTSQPELGCFAAFKPHAPELTSTLASVPQIPISHTSGYLAASSATTTTLMLTYGRNPKYHPPMLTPVDLPHPPSGSLHPLPSPAIPQQQLPSRLNLGRGSTVAVQVHAEQEQEQEEEVAGCEMGPTDLASAASLLESLEVHAEAGMGQGWSPAVNEGAWSGDNAVVHPASAIPSSAAANIASQPVPPSLQALRVLGRDPTLAGGSGFHDWDSAGTACSSATFRRVAVEEMGEDRRMSIARRWYADQQQLSWKAPAGPVGDITKFPYIQASAWMPGHRASEDTTISVPHGSAEGRPRDSVSSMHWQGYNHHSDQPSQALGALAQADGGNKIGQVSASAEYHPVMQPESLSVENRTHAGAGSVEDRVFVVTTTQDEALEFAQLAPEAAATAAPRSQQAAHHIAETVVDPISSHNDAVQQRDPQPPKAAPAQPMMIYQHPHSLAKREKAAAKQWLNAQEEQRLKQQVGSVLEGRAHQGRCGIKRGPLKQTLIPVFDPLGRYTRTLAIRSLELPRSALPSAQAINGNPESQAIISAPRRLDSNPELRLVPEGLRSCTATVVKEEIVVQSRNGLLQEQAVRGAGGEGRSAELSSRGAASDLEGTSGRAAVPMSRVLKSIIYQTRPYGVPDPTSTETTSHSQSPRAGLGNPAPVPLPAVACLPLHPSQEPVCRGSTLPSLWPAMCAIGSIAAGSTGATGSTGAASSTGGTSSTGGIGTTGGTDSMGAASIASNMLVPSLYQQPWYQNPDRGIHSFDACATWVHAVPTSTADQHAAGVAGIPTDSNASSENALRSSLGVGAPTAHTLTGYEPATHAPVVYDMHWFGHGEMVRAPGVQEQLQHHATASSQVASSQMGGSGRDDAEVTASSSRVLVVPSSQSGLFASLRNAAPAPKQAGVPTGSSAALPPPFRTPANLSLNSMVGQHTPLAAFLSLSAQPPSLMALKVILDIAFMVMAAAAGLAVSFGISSMSKSINVINRFLLPRSQRMQTSATSSSTHSTSHPATANSWTSPAAWARWALQIGVLIWASWMALGDTVLWQLSQVVSLAARLFLDRSTRVAGLGLDVRSAEAHTGVGLTTRAELH